MRGLVHSAVTSWRQPAIAALLCACGWAVDAQAQEFEVDPPAEPLSCLTVSRPDSGLPVYPAAVAPGTSAVVRVKFKFTSNDAGPVIEVAYNNGGDAFAQSVLEHVSSYRLPCLLSGQSFSGIQEFQFVSRAPRSAVLESAARDDADGDTYFPAKCLDFIRGLPPPSFPGGGLVRGPLRPGLVVVQLRFSGPDQPPQAEVLFDGGQSLLSDEVRRAVDRYRMPCMRQGDLPIVARQNFTFKIEGSPSPRLQSKLSLSQLLGIAKDLSADKARFDFSTMGCPFEVSFKPYRPYMRNSVDEVGTKDAWRREFIEWLRRLTLDLPLAMQRTALGEETIISVPCALLDLS